MKNEDIYTFSSEQFDSKSESITEEPIIQHEDTQAQSINSKTVTIENEEMEQQNNQQNRTINDKSYAPKQIKEDKYILYRNLPFINRRMTFSRWIERNSFAAIFTFLLFIFGFVVLVSVRIQTNTVQLLDGVMIEMPPVEVEKPKPVEVPEEKKNEVLEIEKMLNVKNKVADANADKDAGMKSDRSNELLKEAQAVQDKLDANKAAYEKGMNEINNMNSSSKGKKSDKNSSSDAQSAGNEKDEKRIPAVSKKGNVTVEYNLPGRYATYLPIPAYKCQEGGKVVISITVDRNGDVIMASVQSATSAKSSCITEMALDAAKQSRFDVKATAEQKQIGTITYIFLAQ